MKKIQDQYPLLRPSPEDIERFNVELDGILKEASSEDAIGVDRTTAEDIPTRIDLNKAPVFTAEEMEAHGVKLLSGYDKPKVVARNEGNTEASVDVDMVAIRERLAAIRAKVAAAAIKKTRKEYQKPTIKTIEHQEDDKPVLVADRTKDVAIGGASPEVIAGLSARVDTDSKGGASQEAKKGLVADVSGERAA